LLPWGRKKAMAIKDFHEKPYDDGTLTKLRIFEAYTEAWIPVFLSRPKPAFDQVHIFDFFAGPGGDCAGTYGSPLRILDQLRIYHGQNLAGWTKAKIVVHLFDENKKKIEQLAAIIAKPEWQIPGVVVDCRPLEFGDALSEHAKLLENGRAAKLLIIDQCGVDKVSDKVFHNLISFPTTDFIFFLSSSTLYRFRNHPAIKQKIDCPEDSYDVHRAAFNYFQSLVPANNDVFLGQFSIKKPTGNIYGLIFGSQHPLGIHKFLQVAWTNDEIRGEANFDIERENIFPGEMVLPFDELRPSKIKVFEADLEQILREGKFRSEADVLRFCMKAGMTGKFSEPVLKKLKSEGVINLDFRVPDVGNFYKPRPIGFIG
jgi:three-Cys-motif partner protein